LRRDKSLSVAEATALVYDWPSEARAAQQPPSGDHWSTWVILAGRGFGKTRAGAEFVLGEVEAGRAGRVALIAEDAADVRDVMIDGESGIRAKQKPWFRVEYIPSRRLLRFPNGAIATTYSGDDPESLRGPQHDLGWVDELAKMRYQRDVWDNYQMGLRLGKHPRTCITTTPRPTALIKEIVRDPHTVITRGSTYDNRDNLAKNFFSQIIRRYEGTRLGRQELDAELLTDTPGALWSQSLIERDRVRQSPRLDRIVVSIDPAASSGDEADETGIIVAGVALSGDTAHGYILADGTLRGTPREWARGAVTLYTEYHADRVIAEKNNGGEMVEEVLRHVAADLPVTLVHASRGKLTRAEPVSALYEQGRIHHVGCFAALEDQMCSYVAGVGQQSPDRMDALVWALTELFDCTPIAQEHFVQAKAAPRATVQEYGSVFARQLSSSDGW